MLSILSIRNVVLIEQLDLNFAPGFSVLTGETGAGKSILLDSLGLALGMRGEIGLIRKGAEEAQVSAVFDLTSLPKDHRLIKLLQENSLISTAGPEENLILRRILYKNGRSKAFINDQPVTAKTLRLLGTNILEIHSQFDGLFDKAIHQMLVDRYMLNDTPGVSVIFNKIKDLYTNWQSCKQELEEYKTNHQQNLQLQAYWRQVVSDLESLKILPLEEDILLDQRQKVSQFGKISSAVKQVMELFYQNDPVSTINTMQKTLERVSQENFQQLNEVTEAFGRAIIEIQEAQSSLSDLYKDNQDGASMLEQVDERLHNLRAIGRRYATPVNDLHLLLDECQNKLSKHGQADFDIEEKQQEAEKIWSEYLKLCENLTELRKNVAIKIEQAISKELPHLKLGNAIFKVSIQDGNPSETGIDSVEFLISTNPVGPDLEKQLDSLNKVASGGELSRLMLALKVILTGSGGLATIVFDEVDTGVGGAVADAIGTRLLKLSQNVQVLAVTHLPQVAARANNHYMVKKSVSNGVTSTTVEPVRGKARTDEIARMLAGASITPEALAMADKLLAG